MHGEVKVRLVRTSDVGTIVERCETDALGVECWTRKNVSGHVLIRDKATIAIFGALEQAHIKLNPPTEVASPDDTGNVAE